MHFICFIHSFIVLLHILWPGPPPSVARDDIVTGDFVRIFAHCRAREQLSPGPGSVISNHHEITLLGPRHVARGTRHMLRRRMAHGHMSPPSPTWSHGLMALSLYQLSDQSRKYILGNLGLRIWATQHASEIPLRNSSDIPTRHTQTAICRYVLAVLCR